MNNVNFTDPFKLKKLLLLCTVWWKEYFLLYVESRMTANRLTLHTNTRNLFLVVIEWKIKYSNNSEELHKSERWHEWKVWAPVSHAISWPGIRCADSASWRKYQLLLMNTASNNRRVIRVVFCFIIVSFMRLKFNFKTA